jgi:hypothetical protein
MYVCMLTMLMQDDLVVLPKDLARNLSNISPLVLVKAVAAEVHIVDPLTGEVSIRSDIVTDTHTRNIR